MPAYEPKAVAQYRITSVESTRESRRESRRKSSRAYDISESSGHAEYHVNLEPIWDRFHRKDLVFYEGPESKPGPIVACTKFRRAVKHVELGFGDLAEPSDIEWSEMRCEKLVVHYVFTVPVGDDRKPHTFVWKRTRSQGIGSRGLKLVDEADRLIAVYSAGGCMSSNTGQIDIYEDFGGHFQLVVLVSALAVRQRLLRSRDAAAAGAASGGAAAAGAGC
ncbi:hypothetical protein N7539_006953 [Penicillium diatomitis]|uniref:Uncharacterized protein n=1 Tax=Penicillium diatomitis TaxID=2819901 RepID=A0A9W9X250_9EURO|nr:uncharacterized protein N7539_006953 [Penicillium diatomitis]KAJ5481059.1 hypothetical protein N7539_006953 [Penicillium diatomitis]